MTMRESTKHLSTIIGVGTGGNGTAIMQMQTQPPRSKNHAFDRLRNWGIVKTEQVDEDVGRAFRSIAPKHFMPAERMAERFRRRHALPTLERQTSKIQTRSNADVSDSILESLKADAPIDPFKEAGLACPTEKKAFYDSELWERRASIVRGMDRFRCQKCGASGTELHVHHKAPIQSAFSRTFYQNFETIRLVTWCRSCHLGYHNTHVRDRKGFHCGTEAEINGKQQQWRRDKRKHDEARECEWCQQFVWS